MNQKRQRVQTASLHYRHVCAAAFNLNNAVTGIKLSRKETNAILNRTKAIKHKNKKYRRRRKGWVVFFSRGNVIRTIETYHKKPSSSLPLFCQNWTSVILCYQVVLIIFLTNCKRSQSQQRDLSSKLASKNISNLFFRNFTGYRSSQESSTRFQPCAAILSLKLTHSI